MKLAITTSGETLDATLNPQFGRAPKFLIHDTESGDTAVIDNHQNLNAAQGAGIQAAETIARAGAQALITGHCGPKAFRVLSAAGIAVYHCPAQTVAAALQAFEQGKLQAAESADVEGHWV